jgi:hypothetical protein
MIQCSMIGKDQVRSGTDLDSLGRDFNTLRYKPISFFEESLRVNYHSTAEYTGLALMYDP